MIRKEGGKFVLYSSDGKKKLGTHPTEAAAKSQESAINIDKARRAGHNIPHVHSMSISGKEPPVEFRILPFGSISTQKGQFSLTPDSAQEIMARYHEHSKHEDRPFNIDFEHSAVKPEEFKNGKAPAAGWGCLELRGDGIWVTNLKWTPDAEDHLRKGEYRYFSPAWLSDENTGEIVQLVNCALTNLPASDRLTALVAASLVRPIVDNHSVLQNRPVRRITTMAHPLAKFLKSHIAEADHDGMAEKMGMAPERMKKLMGGAKPSTEEMGAASKHFGSGLEEHMNESGYKMDGCPADFEEDGEEAHAASLNSLPTEDSKVPGEMAGGDEADETTDAADESDEDKGDKKPKTAAMKPTQMRQEVVTLLKKKDEEIQMLRVKAKQFDELAPVVQELKAESERTERMALIEQGKREKKLTANSIAFWSKQPVKLFRDFLATADVITAVVGGTEKALVGSREISGVTLSAEDVEVHERLKFHGDGKIESFAEMKADIKAGGQEFRPGPKTTEQINASFLGQDGKSVAKPIHVGAENA